MCGRFNLLVDAQAVADLYDVTVIQLAPRYNIAPTQPIAAVRINQAGNREFTHFYWGLIPSWSKDPSFGARLINARSETAHEKPSFRSAFKRRRCVIPASGFYEWQKTPTGKQPMHIHHADNEILSFAGLWEYWADANGNEIESCTILTCAPNAFMSPLHNRMPVILETADLELWLDHSAPLPAVQFLLKPAHDQLLTAYPVSTFVNKAGNDSAECIARIDL